ncbi:hypothetical protein JHE06_07985 [Carnobacterium sp. CS13]|nr:hypothetical protein JHE06_07985 [Carnobacterium sp. CS13]
MENHIEEVKNKLYFDKTDSSGLKKNDFHMMLSLFI